MSDNIFKYPDTNSARAGIEILSEKFKELKIAIIGLGGTGSYILDLVSKTPVKEIHLYDGDIFQLHNAFRAPGAAMGEKLDSSENLMKVEYHKVNYSQMHTGIVAHPYYITETNIQELNSFDYIFISVDKNRVRNFITKALVSANVSFIDVGLGVQRIEDALISSMRITTATTAKNNHLKDRIGDVEFDENEYATNIQIADLNCLNASFAVIKWKRMVGFYQDLKQEHNTLYFVNTNKILNDDTTA